jgi:hypothetical protein
MTDKELFIFFATMYEYFGQWSVINFVKDRQENKQLQHIVWIECNGCDWPTPFLDTNCLVCGGY